MPDSICESKSVASFILLTCHAQCRYFTLKHGNSIFHEDGIAPRKVHWSYDPEAFARWRDGKTGLPLVDANMRELAATGMFTFQLWACCRFTARVILSSRTKWRCHTIAYG